MKASFLCRVPQVFAFTALACLASAPAFAQRFETRTWIARDGSAIAEVCNSRYSVPVACRVEIRATYMNSMTSSTEQVIEVPGGGCARAKLEARYGWGTGYFSARSWARCSK